MRLFRAFLMATALLSVTSIGAGTAQAAGLPPALLTQLTTTLNQCLASTPCKAALGRALADCQAATECNAQLVTFLHDNPTISQILHAVFPSVPCYSSDMIKACLKI